jgi:hypothetical protein
MSDEKKPVTIYSVAWSGPTPVIVSVKGQFNGHTIRDLAYPNAFVSGAFGNRTVIAKTDMPPLGFAFTAELALSRALEKERRLAALSHERMLAAEKAVTKLEAISASESK